MGTEPKNDPLFRCQSCCRHLPVCGALSDHRAMESVVRCQSCNRYMTVSGGDRVDGNDTCLQCSLCNFAEMGCFGRRKRAETKYLIKSHGEMVAAVSKVSHANATLVDRITGTECRARELENKFAQMQEEIFRKEGLCKSSEATLESIKKENAKLKQKLSEIKAENDEAGEQNEMLRLSLREVKEAYEAANLELNNVKGALDKTSSSLEETSKNKEILSSEKESLVSKIKTLQKELEVALKKKHELSDIVDNHEDYKEKIEAEVKKLQRSLSELKEEKAKNEKDSRCNTNYLQRELFRLAERFKRRQRLIERLTADKENLMDSLRQKTSMFDSMQVSCQRPPEPQAVAPGTSGQATANGTIFNEKLNTKILELQLKLDRREGLVHALEDRIKFHEPDFSIFTDEETFLYRDDPVEDDRPQPFIPTHVDNLEPEVPVQDKRESTSTKAKHTSLMDSGVHSPGRLTIDELSEITDHTAPEKDV